MKDGDDSFCVVAALSVTEAVMAVAKINTRIGASRSKRRAHCKNKGHRFEVCAQPEPDNSAAQPCIKSLPALPQVLALDKEGLSKKTRHTEP
eukprot:1161023-Pelagomonas_calceolata.AAC.11